jgi:hypothetical protein
VFVGGLLGELNFDAGVDDELEPFQPHAGVEDERSGNRG